jgi:hypothetical protein
MILRQRAYDGGVLIKLGLVLLIVANAGNYFLHRGNAVPESVSDPVSGFLFGLCFGSLGLGAWMIKRRSS